MAKGRPWLFGRNKGEAVTVQDVKSGEIVTAIRVGFQLGGMGELHQAAGPDGDWAVLTGADDLYVLDLVVPPAAKSQT